MATTVRNVLLLLILHNRGVESIQQIYYENSKTEFVMDFGDKTYPIINPPDSCLFKPADFCDIRDFHRGLKEDDCGVHNLCDNGTLPQCVQNVESPLKEALLICAPNIQCEADARFVVYRNPSKPYEYHLGKVACEDGHFHATTPGSCFNPCIEDTTVRILKKSTPKEPAVAYCNYEYRCCDPNKPRLFSLSADINGCSLYYNISCPPDMERLSDCTCVPSCDDGFRRNPENDFKCEPDIISQATNNVLEPELRAEPFLTGLQVSWRFVENSQISVDHVKVGFKTVNATKMEYLKAVNGSSIKHVDIEELIPGQVYVTVAEIFYKLNNKSRKSVLALNQTTTPSPVLNLTSTLNDCNITLRWEAPRNSMYDHFLVEYKMVGRNPKTSWKQNRTSFTFFIIDTPFPGEEYEFRVYIVSNNVFSVQKVCSLIIPPLPPDELTISVPFFFKTDYKVSWSKYDNKSHVEKWIISYKSSDSDEVVLNQSWSDGGDRVEKVLPGLLADHTYTVMVKSKVKDVFSRTAAQTVIEVPKHVLDKIEHNLRTITVTVLCVGIALILIAVVVGICVFLVKKMKIHSTGPNRITNNFNVGRLSANIDAANRDIHLGGLLESLLPSHCHTQSNSTRSSTSLESPHDSISE